MAQGSESLAHLKDWRTSVDVEGIAWAVIDREGESMNTLGRRVLEELNDIVAKVEEGAKSASVKGLVFISGKDTGFIAGADVREFDQVKTQAEVVEAVGQILGLFDRIEALSVPVVAAIHGVCLGGGLELALACHWRIATREDTTRLGFPEVKLGIFPGFNGTARSIRQAGPVAAMQAMLTGSMLRPAAAHAMGLVDELVPTHHALHWAARKAVLRKRRSEGASMAQNLLRQWPARGLLVSRMRTEVEKKARPDHYPAPYKLIELFEQHGGDLDAMKKAETAAFAPLLLGDTSKNLRRVFKLSEMMKAQAPKSGFAPKRVHVIGAGTMGADIATACVMAGMEVSLQDLSADALGKALAGSKTAFQRRYKTRTEADAAVARLIADQSGAHVGRADVVIEAIVEKLEVKRAVFKALEPKLKPGAVMATNTSSIPIEEIASVLADPGRLIGIHFFNPVALMPLVEVVRGSGAREQEVRNGCGFVTAIGKFPLIVKSSPGFLVNRVLAPYMMEAMARLDQGQKRDVIDEAAKVFGMPMGPLEVADTVGLDICKHVAETIKLEADAGAAARLIKLVDEGKLGKKTGQGLYKWEDGKPVREAVSATQAELQALGAQLVQPMIDECQRCLDAGVVESADMVDAGVIFGSGFAPFRGGPLHYQSSKSAAAPATAAQVKAAE